MLYVVAGYPASGKSTALGLSAQKDIRLFPPDIYADFRHWLPSEVLEETTPTAEKLRRRMWLAYIDSSEFARIAPKPERAVYHMDLLLHLLHDIRPRAMDDFTDQAIRKSFEGFFAGPFCTPYAERSVVTLYPDFLVLRSRWGARMGKVGETDNPFMQMKDQIIMGRNGHETYRRVMGIWAEVADQASTTSHLVRGGKNGNGLPYRPVLITD